jgi:Sulfotransferase domain
MFASRQLPNLWRQSTRRFRHLPTTVVLGGQTDETRRLTKYLTSHPRCFAAAKFETNYFSRHAARSVGWYRSWFPLSFRVARKQGHVVEASTSYLATPSALRLMRQVLPRIRVVVLLSDPVSRAHADFQHRRSVGNEGRSFMQSVADDIRSNAHSAQLGSALQPKAAPMLGYVSRGYYGLQLELLQTLYPRNKVLVMESAAWLQDPRAACERVFNFLGLESGGVDVGTPSLVGRDQELMDPAAATMLREHYRPYDELLSEVCGQQFSWMQPRDAQAA